MEERYVVTFGSGNYKGLKDKRTDEIIVDASIKTNFSSLIPSRHNSQLQLPLVATYNKYGDNAIIVRGVIVINGYNTFEHIDLPDKYNFIDGFDGGLARVYKIIGGRQKWGIIGLYKVGNKLQIKEVVPLEYDNIWSFYDKRRVNVPAYRNSIVEDISLKKLREDIVNRSASNYSVKVVNEIDKYSDEDEYISIEKITLKNFKRYAEQTPIDLSSRITFIVGKNNSGKSTLLGAIELYSSYLYLLHFTDEGEPYFRFDRSKMDFSSQNELYVQYRNFNSPKDDPISLALVSGNWEFSIEMKDSALINRITATNTINGNTLILCKGRTEIYYQKKNYIYECDDKWIYDVSDSENGFDAFFTPILKEYSHFVFTKCPNDIDLAKNAAATIRDSIDVALTANHGIEHIKVFASIGLKKYRHFYLGIGNDYYDQESHFVTKAVINYFDFIIVSDDSKSYHDFVCKWLEKMEIGIDFAIQMDDRDKSYSMKIINTKGVSTDLYQMGSGTIHFVALCLRLLHFVFQYAGNHFAPILLIEEPEQNLHPMLQSHMTNFLLAISNFYIEIAHHRGIRNCLGPKMIVETHSEYIIGRSQVICKACYKRNEPNPFRVYYIPSDSGPYDMLFHPSGKFERRFGPGFTDESSLLTYQLL